MGKRGPAPKPTALRVLHGDRKDRINTNEPLPTEGVPVPPYDLPEDVQEVWDYTCEQLRVMRTITLADRDVLACYCEAVIVHRKASAAMTGGLLLRTRNGQAFQRNPMIQVQRDAAATIRVLAREFGLTPSARAGISVGGESDGAGAERLLS